MAKFKFDGQYLKDGSRVVANVKGDHIRKDRGSTVVANLKDDHIRDGQGSTVIANLKGEDIRKGRGSTRIAPCVTLMGTLMAQDDSRPHFGCISSARTSQATFHANLEVKQFSGVHRVYASNNDSESSRLIPYSTGIE